MKITNRYILAIGSLLIMGSCSSDDSLILLPYSGVQNGGFEYGTFTGWETTGNVEVMNGLDTLQPAEGTFMLMMSSAPPAAASGTEKAFDEQHVNAVEQTFRVKEEHVFLSFHWNFLGERFLSSIGQSPQDYFRVTIAPVEGEEQMLLHLTADLLAGQAGATSGNAGQLLPLSPEVFAGGYLTGWKQATFYIGNYQGEEVKLRFEVVRETAAANRIMLLVDGVDLGEV